MKGRKNSRLQKHNVNRRVGMASRHKSREKRSGDSPREYDQHCHLNRGVFE